jgi:hypothetical protein
MGIEESAERRLGATPEFMRRETRGLTGDLVVKVNSVAEGQGPEVALVMLGPTESGVDHEGTPGANSILDSILGHPVVVMAPDAAVLDSLTFQGKLRGEFLGSVYTIVGTIVANLYSGGGGLALKAKLGLNSLGAGQSDLVDDS